MDRAADRIKAVTLAGTGVIGRGWIRVFTRAGLEVRLFDASRAQLDAALAWLEDTLDRDVASGGLNRAEAARQRELVSAQTDLAEALAGCGYVQESGPENPDIKRAMFTALDKAAAPETILASSTSTLDVNLFAGGLPGERRCLTAHPFNPPYIIPVVEVMGAAGTVAALRRETGHENGRPGAAGCDREWPNGSSPEGGTDGPDLSPPVFRTIFYSQMAGSRLVTTDGERDGESDWRGREPDVPIRRSACFGFANRGRPRSRHDMVPGTFPGHRAARILP